MSVWDMTLDKFEKSINPNKQSKESLPVPKSIIDVREGVAASESAKGTTEGLVTEKQLRLRPSEADP